MRYAVLGTGMVGRTLSAKLASLGHEVVLGTRDPVATIASAGGSGYGSTPIAPWLAEHPEVRLETFAEAAKFGETVVNATNGMSSLEALRAADAANLAGKLLIDVANPLDFSHGMPPTLSPANTDSLAEQIQREFPTATVVKTLNTMNCLIMVDPQRVPGDHNVFVSGDSAEAKTAVTELLVSFGWPAERIIDLGDITSARAAEMLLPIWLRLLGALDRRDFNFHIQGA